MFSKMWLLSCVYVVVSIFDLSYGGSCNYYSGQIAEDECNYYEIDVAGFVSSATSSKFTCSGSTGTVTTYNGTEDCSGDSSSYTLSDDDDSWSCDESGSCSAIKYSQTLYGGDDCDSDNQVAEVVFYFVGSIDCMYVNSTGYYYMLSADKDEIVFGFYTDKDCEDEESVSTIEGTSCISNSSSSSKIELSGAMDNKLSKNGLLFISSLVACIAFLIVVQ